MRAVQAGRAVSEDVHSGKLGALTVLAVRKPCIAEASTPRIADPPRPPAAAAASADPAPAATEVPGCRRQTQPVLGGQLTSGVAPCVVTTGASCVGSHEHLRSWFTAAGDRLGGIGNGVRVRKGRKVEMRLVQGGGRKPASQVAPQLSVGKLLVDPRHACSRLNQQGDEEIHGTLR